MKPLFVYITAKDRAQARRIGGAVVREKLAACANVIDGMESIYFWEGKLCDEKEAVVIVKTTGPRLKALVKRVKKLHSYKVPCIVALPVIDGNPDFLKWIAAETGKK
jgi:periplasmic divalent cation tolerance protein